MIRVVFFAWASVLTAAVSSAQQPIRKPAASAAGATFQVMAVTKSPVLAELVYLRGPSEAIPLNISTGRLSAEALPASPSAPVVIAVKRTDGQGKATHVQVAQVAWPDGAEKAVVFIAVNGSGAGTKVQAFAVDHGLKAFPAKSLRIFNFSGRPLLAQLGDFKGEIAPGPGQVVAYPEIKIPEGSTVGRFPVAFGLKNEQGQPAMFFNGFTEAWPNARTLIVITPPPSAEAERPQIRFILDSLPAPAQPSKQVAVVR